MSFLDSVIGGATAGLFGGSDDEGSDKPRRNPITRYRKLSDEDLAGELGGIESAISRARAAGNQRATGNLSRLQNRVRGFLDDPNYDLQSAAGYKPVDFSGNDWTLSQANATRPYYNDARGGNASRPGVFNSTNDLLYREMTGRKTQADYEQNTKPQLDKIQGQMNEMLDTPALSANYISEARSSIAQTIKGAEENRLRRVSAALGLRGLDPRSPAGSIMAARAALEADSELANSLRDFGMKAEEIEQSSKGAELAMASQLATTRMAANMSSVQGNANALMALNGNITSILEAIRVQKDQDALQRDLLRDQRKQDNKAMYIKAGTSLLGSGMQGIGAAGGMANFF